MPQPLFDLSGKVAIVTGSTKGLGLAMVRGLAEAGAAIVVSSRKQESCDSVAAEIISATGAQVLALACHVGNWDAIPEFFERIVDRFGKIDVLVNNAAITPSRSGMFGSMRCRQDRSAAKWSRGQRVNVRVSSN